MSPPHIPRWEGRMTMLEEELSAVKDQLYYCQLELKKERDLRQRTDRMNEKLARLNARLLEQLDGLEHGGTNGG